jgi:N-hydroxyarylamine O-acetyltransferase
MPFDLDRYLARIGYTGTAAATLETLRAIHLRHPQAIPFENLDPLAGVPPVLDLPELEAKLVDGGRGGYCFEQNLVLRHALDAIGFRVTALGARVVWNAPPGATPARTHMLLRVDLPEGPYIADVGFGGLVLTAPLRLLADIEQEAPHGSYRLTTTDDGYQLEAQLAGRWLALYRFDLHEQQLIDYKVANWYVATNPRSIFVTGIMAARVNGEQRYALLNRELTVYHAGGHAERHVVASVDDLKAALTGPFAITLPDHPGLDAALTRIIATAPPRLDSLATASGPAVTSAV